jgi:hypothetical protein
VWTQHLAQERPSGPPWDGLDVKVIVDDLCDKRTCDYSILRKGLENLESCRKDWSNTTSGPDLGRDLLGVLIQNF